MRKIVVESDFMLGMQSLHQKFPILAECVCKETTESARMNYCKQIAIFCIYIYSSMGKSYEPKAPYMASTECLRLFQYLLI